jgi:AbrB family looped-hinge helix DNA binding protein
MVATTRLSAKFRIEIPKEIRERQGWRVGQEFVFLLKGESVVLVPALEREELFGIAKGANPDNYRDRNDRY